MVMNAASGDEKEDVHAESKAYSRENAWVASKSLRRAELVRRLPRWQQATTWPFVLLYVAWLAWAIATLLSVLNMPVTPNNEASVNMTHTAGQLLNDSLHGEAEAAGVFLLSEAQAKALDPVWIVFWLLVTVHVLALLTTLWSVRWKVRLQYARVATAASSSPPAAPGLCLYLEPGPHRGAPDIVPIRRGTQTADTSLWLDFQKKTFRWDAQARRFVKVAWETRRPYGWYGSAAAQGGLASERDVAAALAAFGPNCLDIPVPAFGELFREHVVAPFFVFQVFCVLLWILDGFIYNSLFTLVMLIAFESIVVFQRIRNLNELRTMAMKPIAMQVKRGGAWTSVRSDALLPGDVVSLARLPADQPVPCDMLLLRGACVVNEALLSGESTPVLKEGIELEEPDMVWRMLGAGRIHALFGGTKIIQITSAAEAVHTNNKDGEDNASLNGCVGMVVRTGFRTSQGKLVRTMYYNSERMTANNAEALLFILFLLIFALAAAAYVWTTVLAEDPGRGRLALLIQCLLIVTAVVPPELPMELSLAVNNSLVALAKLAIFCTEPFRIPHAGRLDVCCFDKTGTLTEEKLVFRGICGTDPAAPMALAAHADALARAHPHTLRTIAACHALVLLDSGAVAGDPMELAAVQAIQWRLLKGDRLASSAAANAVVHIERRFPFSSALRRMAVIASCASSKERFVAVKGAPEALGPLFAPASLPAWYTATFEAYARQGARILALGYKPLRSAAVQGLDAVRQMHRTDVETGLTFAGFLVFACPLKPDSRAAVQSLLCARHKVTMITGDHALTAMHVARELGMLLDQQQQEDTADQSMPTIPTLWLDCHDEAIAAAADGDEAEHLVPLTLRYWDASSQSWVVHEIADAAAKDAPAIYERLRAVEASIGLTPALLSHEAVIQRGFYCISGSAFGLLTRLDAALFRDRLLPRIALFARFSPSAKETALTLYKELGWGTLMCGDGTNDVGALKQAHIGVAVLDGTPEDLVRIAKAARARAAQQRAQQAEETRRMLQDQWGIKTPPGPAAANASGAGGGAAPPPSGLMKKMMEMSEEDQDVPVIKFGDASVAAPFTSKLSSIQSVLHIIRQGRCTLVTTVQMYKILALNSLITAYALSVLHLAGVRAGDFQLTVSGMLMASCFLFLSHAKPIDTPSPKRPASSVFTVYMILSILGQFAIHMASLIFIEQLSYSFEAPIKGNREHAEFVPSLLNSGVYLISLTMHVSTFLINYIGRPFRESLAENQGLCKALLVVSAVGWSAAAELMPDVNAYIQLVPFPTQIWLLVTMFANLAACFTIERVCSALFTDYQPKWLIDARKQ